MPASRLRIKPRWIAAGSVAPVLLLGLWCARTPALPVEVAQPQRAPLRVEVNTNGTVEPLPESELRVHARLAARVIEIPEPGTRVAVGDVVLQLDDDAVSAELAAARGEKLAAAEDLRAARRSLERVRSGAATDDDLFEEGALTAQRHAESRSQLDEAREHLENLEREVPLRIAALDLRLAELEEQFAGTRVLAPFAGTVYRTEVKPGEITTQGAPVLWLADLTRLRVRANVDQVDLGRVAPGQTVRISSNAFADREWRAVVSEIVPHVVVKENRSVSESLALVEPPTDGLVPGMTVDVDIVVSDVANALQVPATAVHRDGGATYVYVVAGGRAHRTPVELGLQGVAAVEIAEGLDADAEVVVGHADDLADGARVEPRSRDVAAR